MIIEYKDNKVVERYYNTLHRMTSFSYPTLTQSEIEEAIDYSIRKRYKEEQSKVYNNYTNKTTEMYLIDLTNYILTREPICTASGVMFKKRGTVPNPLIRMIQMFMDNRGIHKKEMFKYEKGSEMFEKYNLLQLLDKIDCNAIYGTLGANSSVYYNIHVAQSITMNGRALISSATMFFEMFLSNNVKFGSLNEIIMFIDNIITEKPNRKYKDSDIIDKDKFVDPYDVFVKLILTVGDFRKGRIKWIPSDEDLEIIWNIISRLNQEDLNRIYYKNNLYAFMENQSMIKSLIYILSKLENPYLDPNDVPKEIKVELDVLCDILKEYVYYPYQIIDRIDRCDNMIKNISVISDTDSAIISLDAWYRFVLNIVKDIPMNITRHYTNPIEYLEGNDKYICPISYADIEYDYDFFSEEIIEKERLIHPVMIIPQDNLRYSIINIMAYIAGELVNDYMELFTKQSYSYEPGRKCMLYLKNEFLFKRVLLTNNKKNYASIQELQEGNRIPRGIDTSLDIKGLPITKSVVSDRAKKELKKILYEDILNIDKIDQVAIIKKLAILEKRIYQSLQSGESEFYKPAMIKSYTKYDDPMRIQGVKGAVIWNAIRDPELEAIDLEARNTVNIIKVDITPDNIEKIKDDFPEAYERLKNCMNDRSIFPVKVKDSAYHTVLNEIAAVSIPTDIKTPVWLREFIDYKSIINDCLKNFPIESIGIVNLGNANVNYSNIMKI